MDSLSFFIPGIPAPGGSKNAFVMRNRRTGAIVMRPGTNAPVINMVDAGKNNKQWKRAVAAYARTYWEGSALSRACVVDFEFILSRPKSHFGSGKNAEKLKPTAPIYHTQKPDASKLRRSTEDALSGIVYADDAYIVRGSQHKRWCGPGEEAGCLVTITPSIE